MAFVTSDRYGAQWKGSLVVGSLKFQRLERLTIRSGKVTASEQVLPRLASACAMCARDRTAGFTC